MGCRPSKQATSKVRAVDESLCLCSPKKVRKNHKCSSSSAKSAAMGSKKHSLSSGHKPRALDVASMDFPAFSTTTAVYRKSASKTSKITLRLSCDGSTLEIEQCDYDLEKGSGDLTPKPRPWHSAPNLTYLKDKKCRHFMEKPLKHSKSTWSPSVSSTVSGCLTMRVPAVVNAIENQTSNKSLAVSRPSSDDSQADCGSSSARCNTGKTPLLRTGCKLNSAFGYKNSSNLSCNTDGAQPTCTLNDDYAQQRLRNSSSNNIDSRVHPPQDIGKTTKFKTRTQYHEARDECDFSSEFEHIPVNVITSFGPPLRSDKSYRLTDSNHNQFRLSDCCLQDSKTKAGASFASRQVSRSVACSQQESLGTRELASDYRVNNFSSHEAMPMYTSRDNSPVSCDSQIDSNSILTFVTLGCPVPNETSNCSYSDDDDAVGLFTPRHEVTVLQGSNDVIDMCALNSASDAFPRELRMPARNHFGDLWGSQHGEENNSLVAVSAMGSLQDTSRYCNGFTNRTKLTNHASNVMKKDSKQEWIDGELRVVKAEKTDLERCSNRTSECWSNVKFPVMKTHIPASAVLHDSAETLARDQVTNNNGGLSSGGDGEISNFAGETGILRSAGDSSAWTGNHLMNDDLNSDSVQVKSRNIASMEYTFVDIGQTLDAPSITADSSNFRSANDKSIDLTSNWENSVALGSVNANLELKDFQISEDNELRFSTTNIFGISQKSFCTTNSEHSSSPTLQNKQNNPSSLSFIEQVPSPHRCGSAKANTEASGSSLNHYVNQDFHDEPGVDTLKNTAEIQKADYLMELLINDTSDTTKLEKESIFHFGFDNFMENGIYSLTESSGSESGLMWYKDYTLLSHATESRNLETMQAPASPTNLNLVKINILNTNLNSLDPSKDSIYNKVTPPISLTSMSPDILFTIYNKLIGEDLAQTECTEVRDQRDEKLFKQNNMYVMVDHLTLNGPLAGVRSLGNCKNVKSAQERRTGEVNDYLSETSKLEALQRGGQPHTSGIMPCAQDTRNSKIQTRLCPLALSPNREELDFKGETESMHSSSELPHSTYCERNLNGKNIDPSENNNFAFRESYPAILDLSSHWSLPRFVHISRDSSNCHVKPFLCKTGPRENECVRYNGGHLGSDSIYIETNDIFRTCDCTCDCLGHRDCPLNLNSSTSQTGPHVLSQLSVQLTSDLDSQTSDSRLNNLKHAAMGNDLEMNSYKIMDNFPAGCQAESLFSHVNNYCNKQFIHCNTDCTDTVGYRNSGHYTDTLGYRSSDHYTDTLGYRNSDHYTDTVGYRNSDHYTDTLGYRSSDHYTDTVGYRNSDHYTDTVGYRNSDHNTDTVGYRNSDHYTDTAGNRFGSMSHNNTEPYKESMNQSKEDQNNESTVRRIQPMSGHEEDTFCYKMYQGQSNSPETQQDAYAYISGPKFRGGNSYYPKADAFDVHTLEAITSKPYYPIRDKFKRTTTQTPRSHFLSDKEDMLDSTRAGHLADIDVCKRQKHTDLIFQEYSYYRHFSEPNFSESIPRNNVLSLVRYFEKVPFINNNAK